MLILWRTKTEKVYASALLDVTEERFWKEGWRMKDEENLFSLDYRYTALILRKECWDDQDGENAYTYAQKTRSENDFTRLLKWLQQNKVCSCLFGLIEDHRITNLEIFKGLIPFLSFSCGRSSKHSIFKDVWQRSSTKDTNMHHKSSEMSMTHITVPCQYQSSVNVWSWWS